MKINMTNAIIIMLTKALFYSAIEMHIFMKATTLVYEDDESL